MWLERCVYIFNLTKAIPFACTAMQYKHLNQFCNNVWAVVEKVRRERVLTTNSQGTAAMIYQFVVYVPCNSSSLHISQANVPQKVCGTV